MSKENVATNDAWIIVEEQAREMHAFMEALREKGVEDPRWLAIARTHFQEGFMAARRAAFGEREGTL